MRRAFTLIELLVVIAIIAILAAILFPVFAQAKLAAKKTADLSNVKQLNLGTAMYVGDFDDLYPLCSPKIDGNWIGLFVGDLPWNAYPGQSDFYYASSKATWGNTIMPYVKSGAVYESSIQEAKSFSFYVYPISMATNKYYSANFAMNGLLEGYSASMVNRPSNLISFSQPLGNLSFAAGFYSEPSLYCPDPNVACRYQTPSPTCYPSTGNGEWSYTWNFGPDGINLRAAYGNGSNYAYADGSAKFRRMFGNVNGATDFHTDPYSNYDSQGNASYSWWDSDYCHPLLFMPDFDYENWGHPVQAY